MSGTVYTTPLLKVYIYIKVILYYQHLSLSDLRYLYLISYGCMGTRSYGTAGIDKDYIQFVVLEIIEYVIEVTFLSRNNRGIDKFIVALR